MLKKDAVKFYGSPAKLAQALKIHRSAVKRWTKWVPLVRALQLERMTSGGLKCDTNAYTERK
jgi:DNA-binding transcriptional regulator YdaS (Cro superfamily)